MMSSSRPAFSLGNHLLALLTAGTALALLVAGSLVHSYQAAQSVPDWPLSYGHLVPRHWNGNAFYESLHRVLAAAVAILTLGFAVALRSEPLTWVRRGGVIAAALLALQIALGGVIVLAFEPPWVSAVHTVLAQVFFAWVVLLAAATASRWPERLPVPGTATHPAAYRRVHVVLVLIFVQICLGATSRHAPSPDVGFYTLMLHVLNAFAVLIALTVMIHAFYGTETGNGARTAGVTMLALVIAQLMIGMGVMMLAPGATEDAWPPPPRFPTFHAAHMVLSSLLLALGLVTTKSLRVRAETFQITHSKMRRH